MLEEAHGSRYITALREHWLLIVGVTLAAVAAAAVYSFTAPKAYEAKSELLVTPVSSSDDMFFGLDTLRESTSNPDGSVLVVARLVETADVARAVAARLGGDRGALLESVEVKPVTQANIVTITATATTASRAADVANAFANETIALQTAKFQRQLGDLIERLSDQLRAIPAAQRGSTEAADLRARLATLRLLVGDKDPTLEVFTRAAPPASAAWPRPVLSIGVALLAGLLLGLGAALGLEFGDPRIKHEDELVFGQRLRILTRVPRLLQAEARDYLAARRPLPEHAWEAWRTLRATLATAGRDGGFPRTILVTSATPGEGKTMTAANLSIVLAAGGLRVVLVDADLRRPMLGTVFGVPTPSTALADLVKNDDVEVSLVRAPGHGDRLRLLLGRVDDADLVDHLDPRRIERVLAQVREEADVVVIDSPALTEVADALTLADAAEAVVVAVRLGHTRRDRLNELRRLLSQRGVALTGVVVTSRKRGARQSHYYQPSRELSPVEANPQLAAAARERRGPRRRQPIG